MSAVPRGDISPCRGRSIVEGPDNGARLLGQPVGRARQVRGEGDGRHAGIGDADVGETIDAEVRIDDAALFQREHRACRRWMKLGEALAAQPVLPLLIRLDLETRVNLVQHDVVQRVSLTHATGELDTLAQNLDVYEKCQSQARRWQQARHVTYQLGAPGNWGR